MLHFTITSSLYNTPCNRFDNNYLSIPLSNHVAMIIKHLRYSISQLNAIGWTLCVSIRTHCITVFWCVKMMVLHKKAREKDQILFCIFRSDWRNYSGNKKRNSFSNLRCSNLISNSAQKMFSIWDLVTFTEEILHAKHHICAVWKLDFGAVFLNKISTETWKV